LLDYATGPEISISSPLANTNYTSEVTVTGTATDQQTSGASADEVVSVEYQVPNLPSLTTLQPVETLDGDGNFGFTFATDGYSGSLSIIVKATDLNGRTTTENLVLLADANGPVLTIDDPTDQSYYRSSVTIDGFATNRTLVAGELITSELDTLTYKVGSLEEVSIRDPSFGDFDENTGAYSFTLDTTPLTGLDFGGTTTVKVYATDKNGRVTVAPIELLDYATGPVISISSPLANTNYTSEVTVTGTATDQQTSGASAAEVVSVEYQVPNLPSLTTLRAVDSLDPAGNFSFEFLTNGYSGSLSVIVKATDLNGRTTTENLVLLADANGPVLTIDDPTDQSYYRSSVTVLGTVEDRNPVQGELITYELLSLMYKVGSADELPITNLDTATGEYSFTLDATGFSGTTSVKVYATDKNNRPAMASIDLLDYGTGPEISVISPLANSNYTSKVIVTGKATDQGTSGASAGEVVSVKYQVPNIPSLTTLQSVNTLNPDGTFSFEFSAAGYSGSLSIVIQAEDENGRTRNENLVLLADADGPVLTIENPDDQSNWRSSVTVDGFVENRTTIAGQLITSEIDTLTYKVGNLEQVSIRNPAFGDFDETTGAYSFTLDTTPSTGLDFGGTTTIKVYATDKNGRVTIEPIELLDYGTGPEISVTSPLANTNYTSLVTVTGTATDQATSGASADEVVSVKYQVPNLPAYTVLDDVDSLDADGNFIFEFSTVGYSGSLSVVIQAKDKNDRTTSTNLILLADSDGPNLSIENPGDQTYWRSSVSVDGFVADRTPIAGELITYELATLTYKVGTGEEVSILDPANGSYIPGTGAYSFILDTTDTLLTGLDFSGTTTIKVYATDKNGRVTIESVDLLDYGTGPEVSISSPFPNSNYTSSVKVVGTATDQGTSGLSAAEVTGVTYLVPSLPNPQELDVDYLGADGAFDFTFPTLDYAGSLSIVIYAVDENGRKTTETLVLIADSRGPILSLDDPADQSYYRSSVTVEGNVVDRDPVAGQPITGELATLTYRLGTGDHVSILELDPLVGELDAATGDYWFDINTVAEGFANTTSIKVYATDKNGRETVENISLLSYTGGPEITITDPANFSEYKSSVTVNGIVQNQDSAADSTSEVKTLTYRVQGLVPTEQNIIDRMTAVTGDFDFTFSTAGQNGFVYVYVTATDKNGRTTEKQFTLVNDGVGPYIDLASPEDQDPYVFSVGMEGLVRNESTIDPDPDKNVSEVASLRYEIPAKAEVKWLFNLNGVAGDAQNPLILLDEYDDRTPFDRSPDPSLDPLDIGYFQDTYTIVSGTIGNLRINFIAEDLNGNETVKTVDLLDTAPGPEVVFDLPLPYTAPGDADPSDYYYSHANPVKLTIKAHVIEPDNVQWATLSYLVRSGTYVANPQITTHAGADFDFEVDFPTIAADPGTTTGDAVRVIVQARDDIGRSSETELLFVDDSVPPTITDIRMSDGGVTLTGAINQYAYITFSEPVWTGAFRADPDDLVDPHDGAVVLSDLDLDFTSVVAAGDNEVGATAASITAITKDDGAALVGGETVIRAELSITTTANQTPNGADFFILNSASHAEGAANSIHDQGSNPIEAVYVAGADDVRLHDQKPPKIIKSETQDLDVDGQIDRIVVTLSEPVDDSTLTTAAFTVDGGHTVDSVATGDVADDKIVWLNIEETGIDTAETPLVTIVANILSDVASPAENKRTLDQALAAIDTAPPAIVGATTEDMSPVDGKIDRIIVTLSEAVDDATLTTNAFTVDGHTVTGIDTAGTDDDNLVGVTISQGAINTAERPAITLKANKLSDGAAVANARAADQDPQTPDDTAPPAIVQAITRDTDEDGKIDRVVVTLSESVEDSSFQAGTDAFSVDGHVVSDLDTNDLGLAGSLYDGIYTPDDTTVAIDFNEVDFNTAETPTVTLEQGVLTDRAATPNARNAYTLAQDFDPADGAPPAIVASETRDAVVNGKIDRIIVSLSEPIDDSTLTGAFAIAAHHSPVVDSHDGDENAVVGVSFAQLSEHIDTAERPQITILANKLADSAANKRLSTQGVLPDDEAPPAIVAAETRDVNEDGRIDRLVVTLSEPVEDDTRSGSLDVAGYTGESVSSGSGDDDDELWVDFTESGFDTIEKPDVTLVEETLSDLVANDRDSGASQLYESTLDKAPPVLLTRETADLDGNGYLDAVYLTFSENIVDATVSAADFDVAGVSGESFSPTTGGDGADDAHIYVSIADGVHATHAVPTVSHQAGNLADDDDNLLTSNTSVAAADKAGPAIWKRETADLNGDGYLDAVRITFSEAISDGSVDTDDFSVAGAVTIGTFSSTTNGDTAGDDDIYLTFTDDVHITNALPIVGHTNGTLTDDDSNLLTNTTSVASTDKAGPAIWKRETADLNGDGYLDAVRITFSEAISDGSVDTDDFSVAGAVTIGTFSSTTNGDTAGDDDIYLTFTDDVHITNALPIVGHTDGTLTDDDSNLLTNTTSVASTDKAGPAI
jgi:hypothetical protein